MKTIVNATAKANCPLCAHPLTWKPTNPTWQRNEDVTHIYVCPECPFIGLEYYEQRNIDDLIRYLDRPRGE